ncbi:probable G-protein coupled receptor Mth-like 3 isoform X1 [Drosophila subpulchrella]|uniref:probable G-protein coupled receptor Mth-like 3 isoform X1 n=1 Tax=Drosophila subpulchrella TaxID=1486046 RepID=UPI0018A180ED|nr:probable G-protein coupled receptor Mth-like 3 isoform X1 [Drosophila subpulchrella]
MIVGLSLVCLILSGISKVFAVQICCGPNSVLFKYLGSDNSEIFECASAERNLKEFPDLTQVIGKMIAPKGLGLEAPNESSNQFQLSKCKNFTSLNLSELSESTLYLRNNSCIGLLNKRLIVLSCEFEKNVPSQSVGFVNKCCPQGFIYVSENNTCILGANDFFVYTSIISSPIIFFDNALNCSENKALVEYTVSSEKVRFNNNSLVWRDGSNSLPVSKFCIEAIYDSYALERRKVSDQKYLVRACQESKICQKIPCIRRCCAEGEMYAKGNTSTYCKNDGTQMKFEGFQNLNINANFSKPSDFGLVHGLQCQKFRLDPDNFPDDAHTISASNGSLIIHNTSKMYAINQYCVERVRPNQKLYTFLCFDTKVVGNDRIRFKMYPIGLLISCCFYALTLIVYISIAKLRNLPGKILICLVSSLFLAYLGIALGQLKPTSNDDICFFSGFFVYFCLMAAFSWMNITSFDIWKTFGSTKIKSCEKSDLRRQFIWYSCYGWGLPTLLTTITIAFTKSDILPDVVRPNFGHGRCWFTYDSFGSASLLFFSGPVGILFIFNLVLFLLTMKYCNKVKNEIYKMQSLNSDKPVLKRRFFQDKTRFVMNTKLCFVMGITWLLELVSIVFYDHKTTFFWTISDSFNVLLGIFVFIIFVFKRRIYNEILVKFGLQSSPSTTSTRNRLGLTKSYAPTSTAMTTLRSSPGSCEAVRKTSSKSENEVML